MMRKACTMSPSVCETLAAIWLQALRIIYYQRLARVSVSPPSLPGGIAV